MLLWGYETLTATIFGVHYILLQPMAQYENVMFTDRGNGRSKLEIKIIDFGLSMKYGRSRGELDIDMTETMSDFVGTIYTMAPEVISGDYT